MKVSVVTPSYRQLAYLKLCVASIADQTGVEVEHIIQDAGSGEELEKWANEQPRVRLFVEKDAGMYDGINRGLRRADGEICAYLNCDEQYLPNTLATVSDFFAAHPAVDVLFGDTILIDRHGYPISYRRTVLPKLRHIRIAHLNTHTCSTFFRRKLLEQGFYFDPTWKDVGDAVWMERLLTEKVRMATLPEPLAVFTLTGENRSALPWASEEASSRRAVTGLGGKIRRGATIIAHRVRKALAGSYRRRDVDVQIFTIESPITRQHRVAKQVGFAWPSSVQRS